MITGYMYIRSHPSWDIYECYKIGITENIINRESQYITSEIEKGILIKIFKFDNIEKEYFNKIDLIVKKELLHLNFIKNAGTEFYKYDCVNKIEGIFIKYHIKYIELSNNEINKLSRKIYFKNTKNILNVTHNYMPRNDQINILNKCNEYFINNDKGILILPCGFGKTIISLLFLEYLKINKIVIGVPNILLLHQWKEKIKKCIQNNCKILLIYQDITIKDINNFINTNTNYIIICVYSSSHKLYKASESHTFDILINDEVHHLTSQNSLQLNKEYVNILKINCRKQLSLTATIKVLDNNYSKNNIISNDSVYHFGNIIESKSLLWAIKNNLICDYEIQTIITTESNILDILNNLQLQTDINKLLFASAYASVMSIYQKKSHHLLIYANSTENCTIINEYIKIILNSLKFNNCYYSDYHSKLSKNKKEEIINSFEESKFGILSCVYCLGEGWDLPLLDGVVFAENMYSNIRIVQSALRGCRKNINEPNKINKIILPILNKHNTIDNFNIFDSDEFIKVKEIVTQLGLEDETIISKFKILNTIKINKNSNTECNCNYSIEFYNDITKQFILKSISRKQFTISYNKAKEIIKNYNINSIKNYYIICEKDIRLPMQPKELYKNWIDWIDYLSIDKSNFYDLNTCKLKIKEYIKKNNIILNRLDLYTTCLSLCQIDNKFPYADLWIDFYNITDLNKLFSTKTKRFG